MEKINQLLLLNIEIDGLLRTIMARPNTTEAMDMLWSKCDQFQSILAQLKETERQSTELAKQENYLEHASQDRISDIASQDNLQDIVADQKRKETNEKENSSGQNLELTIAQSIEPQKTTVAENISPAAEFKVENMIAQREAGDLSRAFSINDKYRFIRDLFGNNKEKFDIIMQRVATMNSLSQAYEYFLDELAWDADDPAVSDFLAIIANHFNSAQ